MELAAAVHTHKSEPSGQIFDFLVDETAELEMALCAFGRVLLLRLCAFHTSKGTS